MAKIVAEAVKGRVTPLPVGVSWNAALQTIDTSVKKLGFGIPFTGMPLASYTVLSSLSDLHFLATEDYEREISDVVRIVEAP